MNNLKDNQLEKELPTAHCRFLCLLQISLLERVSSLKLDLSMKSTPYPAYAPANFTYIINKLKVLSTENVERAENGEITSSMNRTPGTSSAIPSSMYRLTTCHLNKPQRINYISCV